MKPYRTDSKKPPTDATIRVAIQVPASVYVVLRDHAAATGTTIAKLCREGALRELERAKSSEEACNTTA